MFIRFTNESLIAKYIRPSNETCGSTNGVNATYELANKIDGLLVLYTRLP